DALRPVSLDRRQRAVPAATGAAISRPPQALSGRKSRRSPRRGHHDRPFRDAAIPLRAGGDREPDRLAQIPRVAKPPVMNRISSLILSLALVPGGGLAL